MWRSSSYSALATCSVGASPVSTSMVRPQVSLRRSPQSGSCDRVAPTPPLAPCSTTTLDFHRHPLQSPRPPRTWRRGTPRGNNPHPVGLVFQSPYNRHNKVTKSCVCIYHVRCHCPNALCKNPNFCCPEIIDMDQMMELVSI